MYRDVGSSQLAPQVQASFGVNKHIKFHSSSRISFLSRVVLFITVRLLLGIELNWAGKLRFVRGPRRPSDFSPLIINPSIWLHFSSVITFAAKGWSEDGGGKLIDNPSAGIYRVSRSLMAHSECFSRVLGDEMNSDVNHREGRLFILLKFQLKSGRKLLIRILAIVPAGAKTLSSRGGNFSVFAGRLK